MSTARKIVDIGMERARASFEHHRIVRETPDRWLVKSEKGSAYWFEVVILAGGKMLFHGDTDPILFAYYRPPEGLSEADRAVATVRWMASRARPDDRYFVEKAKIGTGSDDLIWSENVAVFRDEMGDLIDEELNRANDEDEDDFNRKEARDRAQSLQDLRDHLDQNDLKATQEEIYDLLGDSERIPDGRVVTPGMIFAHAGLQKLLSLLEARRVSEREHVQ